MRGFFVVFGASFSRDRACLRRDVIVSPAAL